MVNDACRRSHEFQDEPRGKPKWVGVHVSERLSSINRGKTSRGKPRSKPESGNPTFRDCRGARGNVTWSLRRGARASALSRPFRSNVVRWCSQDSKASACKADSRECNSPHHLQSFALV